MPTVTFKFAIGQKVCIKGSGKKVTITQQCIDNHKIKEYCCRYFTHDEGIKAHCWASEKELEEIKKPKLIKKTAKKITAKKSGRIRRRF